MTITEFLDHLRWIDGTPLRDSLEPYRRRIFEQAFEMEGDAFRYNLVLCGRAKKNWKSADLIFALLWALLEPRPGRKECFLAAFDEDQAANDLTLLKLLIRANPALSKHLSIRQNIVSRRDGQGFAEVLPGQSHLGEHGRTFRFLGIDEIHTQKTWDLLEALQPDPTRLDAQTWITSYASVFHRVGVPLFDLCAAGRAGQDPRMLFSWYAADFTTDSDFADADPETRANPSCDSWADANYLEQQKRRLPAHKFRRLHLNLPGLPEGSAFTAETVMSLVDRSRVDLPSEPGRDYRAFVDMSGGSSDDAVLAIGSQDPEGHAVVARVLNQGPPPPFDPRKAVARFADVCKEYGCSSVTGDSYAGETFKKDFEEKGITYRVAGLSKSKLYEALEPHLNGARVLLPNVPEVEQQLLGLVWRGGKIDHPGGEHDDYANAVAGLVHVLLGSQEVELKMWVCGDSLASRTAEEIQADAAEADRIAREASAEAVLSAIRSEGWYWPGGR
ncbi:MAG: hypothetical protein HY724_00765 [Candidatus Rokubacteria bacterium]|nr:hypothetical protein [Candidatus Rokubacteria bacterium]